MDVRLVRYISIPLEQSWLEYSINHIIFPLLFPFICLTDEADKVNITRGIPHCYAPLGMQNGQIPNASVTASSNFGSAHRARLYTVAEGGKPGAWVAAVSDTNQWLQVKPCIVLP